MCSWQTGGHLWAPRRSVQWACRLQAWGPQRPASIWRMAWASPQPHMWYWRCRLAWSHCLLVEWRIAAALYELKKGWNMKSKSCRNLMQLNSFDGINQFWEKKQHQKQHNIWSKASVVDGLTLTWAPCTKKILHHHWYRNAGLHKVLESRRHFSVVGRVTTFWLPASRWCDMMCSITFSHHTNVDNSSEKSQKRQKQMTIFCIFFSGSIQGRKLVLSNNVLPTAVWFYFTPTFVRSETNSQGWAIPVQSSLLTNMQDKKTAMLSIGLHVNITFFILSNSGWTSWSQVVNKSK